MIVFISWLVSFGVCTQIQYFCDVVRNKLKNNKYLFELIKRKSKVQEKNMPCQRGLNFYQSKAFSENCKPIRVCYVLPKNLPRIIVACNFSPSTFKLRRGILPLLTKYVS